MTFTGLAILGLGFGVMTLALAQRVRTTGVKLHYAWFIVAMATILQLTTNVVSQAFAILMVVLQENFSWTLTSITLAYFFRSIVGAVLSPVSGWVGDRYGARRSMLVVSCRMVAMATMNQA